MEVEETTHSLGGAPLMVNITTLSRLEATNELDKWLECMLLWQVLLPNNVLLILAVIMSRQEVRPPCFRDGSDLVFARPLFVSSINPAAFSQSGLARPHDACQFAPQLPAYFKCVHKAAAKWCAQQSSFSSCASMLASQQSFGALAGDTLHIRRLF